MKTTIDHIDAELVAKRTAEYLKSRGVELGHFVRMPDQSLRRITHCWGSGFQTTVGGSHPCFGDESFYMGSDGTVSFSGSLDSPIDKAKLSKSKDTHPGKFWMFSHNEAKAHNGVRFTVDCPVWTVTE